MSQDNKDKPKQLKPPGPNLIKKLHDEDDPEACEIELSLGQYELILLAGKVRGELWKSENTGASSLPEHQVLLGKEEALKWVLEEIARILEGK